MSTSEPTSAELDEWAWAECLLDEANVSVGRRSNEPGLISDLDPFIRQALTALYGFGPNAFDLEGDTLPQGSGYSTPPPLERPPEASPAGTPR
jgi:hypothetical protein